MAAFHPAPHGPGRALPWFDVVRATAALLVLLSHIRKFTLRDAAEQPALSILARAFFAVSGLGHQAVIVFFVLSGFLVAASMRRRADEGQWSLLRFVLERLARLWPVLIPCLLLGGLLDEVGLQLTTGDPDHYGRLALTAPVLPPAHDGATLLGNVAFLQTIAVPVYGSNGPLWSLADEAWFYALGAFAFSAWCARARGAWALPLMVFALLAAWLPGSVLGLFPIWLFGAASCLVAPKRMRKSGPPRLRLAVTGLGVVAALLVSRLHRDTEPLAADYALGMATAGLLRCLAVLPFPNRAGLRPLLGLSAMSYSLYLSHVPMLALLTTVLVGSHRFGVGLASSAVMLLELAVTLAWAGVVWWAFERRAPRLRLLMLRYQASSRHPTSAALALRNPVA